MTWDLLPLELRGTWDIQGERVLLEESTVKIGAGHGTLQGVLGPEIALEGSWEGVRLEELAFALPGARSDDCGKIAGRVEVRGTYQDPLISGELSLEEGRLRGISLDGGFASGVLTPPLLRVKELRGSIQGAPWRGEMSADLSPGRGWVEGRGWGQSVDLAPWGPLGILPPGLQGGLERVDLFFQLRDDGATGRIFFRGLEASLGAWEIAEGRCLGSLSPQGVTFQGSGRWLGSPVKVSGDVMDPLGAPRISASIALVDLPLDRLGEPFPTLRPEGLKGRASLNATLRGSLEAPELQGRLGASALEVRGMGLENVRGDFLIKNGRLELSRGEGTWRKSPLTASGVVEATRCDLRGTAENLPSRALVELIPALADLAPGGTNSVQWKVEGPLSRPRGEVTLRSPQASLRQVPLGSLVMEGSWEGDRFTLRRCQAETAERSLSMKGSLSLGKNPEVDLRGSFKGLYFRDLKPLFPGELSADARLLGEFAFRGPLSRPEAEATFAAERIKGLPVDLTGIKGELSLTSGRLTVRRLTASGADGGTAALSGHVLLGGDPTYFIHGTLQDIPLQNTHSFLGDRAGLFLRGKLSGTLSVDQRGQSVVLRFRGAVPRLIVNGLSFSDVTGTLGTDGKTIHLAPLRGAVGPGWVTASVDASPEGEKEGWRVDFTARGQDLEVESLLQNAGKSAPSGLQGRFFARIQGRLSGSSLKGEGSLGSSSLALHGFTVNDLTVPLRFDGKGISVEKARAQVYGGTMEASGRLAFQGGWNASVQISSADVSPLLKDVAPLSGDVSGRGNLKATLSGRLGNLYATEAQLAAEVVEGRISGFSAAQAMASATDGGKSVAFSSIRSTMTVNGRVLYILPGSRMAAPPGDSSYRYLMVDGSLPLTGKPMNLSCLGEINARSLNTFLGALKGLMDAAQNTEHLVQDVILGGLVGGTARRDFRQVSFKVKGPLEDPVISDLSVSGKIKTGLNPPLVPGEVTGPTNGSGPKGQSGSDISLTLSFPTGKGSAVSDDVEGQLQQQLLEILLKQVIPGDAPKPTE